MKEETQSTEVNGTSSTSHSCQCNNKWDEVIALLKPIANKADYDIRVINQQLEKEHYAKLGLEEAKKQAEKEKGSNETPPKKKRK